MNLFLCVLVTGPGFDLRSRLGPKVNDKKKVAEQSVRKGQKHVVKKAGRQLITTEDDNIVEKKSDKELKLDARIERIRVKNEEIKKRQEEIEREKMLYG